MYLSDKPNYPLIQTVLDSLQQELRLLLDPPDGSKEHPATTCHELWLCRPEYSSGRFIVVVVDLLKFQLYKILYKVHLRPQRVHLCKQNTDVPVFIKVRLVCPADPNL